MTIANSTKDSVETTTKKVLIMTTLTIPDSVLFLSMRAIKMTMKTTRITGIIKSTIY